MSTTAKFVMATVILLGLALALEFAPIYASGEDCGSAFVAKDNPFLVSQTCIGRTDMVRYWAIVLISATILAGIAAAIARTEANDRRKAAA